MEDQSFVVYTEIIDNIINQNLNKIEAKNTLANILENYSIKQVENDPLRYDLSHNVKLYLEDKERQGLSEQTLYTYKIHLKLLTKFIDKKIQQITKQDIYEYIDWRQEDHPLQNSTLETVRSVLRSFFEWLKDEEIINENPIMKIKPFKCKKSVVKFLSIEELEMVRENAHNIRAKSLIEFLYSTGVRLDELIKLNIHDIEWNNRVVKVLGKGNKERVVFFSPRTSFYLKKYLKSRDDDCEALFVTERKEHRRLTGRGVQRVLDKIGKMTNINLHPHRLRHTFSTNLLNSGAEITVVKDLLGHDQLSTTAIYAKATQSYKQQCYDRFFNQ